MAFEGQAAMLLEGLAEQHGATPPLAAGYTIAGDDLDLLPLLAAIAELDRGDPVEVARGAALFHATLIDGLVAWVSEVGRRRGLDRVALAGGCLLNHILSRGLRERLGSLGFTVYEATALPPNDGGISLGQAWVAMCR